MQNKNFPIPAMIYGTAWKEERTADLVKLAVKAGFRAIDTANQKKHYREDYLGSALLEIYSSSDLKIRREDLFLQSKYTYQRGQDHRLPYDPKSDFSTQVADSFSSSLKNLHTDYLDSYLLHGPSSRTSLTSADWEVWRAMEMIYEAGQTRKIGVSNVEIHHLRELFEKAKVKPQVVQNRCFAVRGWDKDVRDYCAENHIVYQGFSLLTANQQVLFHPQVEAIAANRRVTPAQLLFRFSIQINILPITGTTQLLHMKQDLEALTFELSKEEVGEIASIL